MRARDVAFKPYSPNATVLPLCASPVLPPLNCLRYLVRLGCMRWLWLGASGRRFRRGRLRLRAFAFGRRRRLVGLVEHFALEDPRLDADDAVGGLRFGEAVVDVRAERVQRNAAFARPF